MTNSRDNNVFALMAITDAIDDWVDPPHVAEVSKWVSRLPDPAAPPFPGNRRVSALPTADPRIYWNLPDSDVHCISQSTLSLVLQIWSGLIFKISQTPRVDDGRIGRS